MAAHLGSPQNSGGGLEAVVGAPLSPQMIALFREAMHFDSLEANDVAAHSFVVFGASASARGHYVAIFVRKTQAIMAGKPQRSK
ncbi:glucose-6-phosphate 1-dehydrogenase X-like [Tropilaelaps mercedesae]|uniref:Glucose-6-phosphate 1-dehydrogenase X-like n=1 Tax=Tropilaelaps mercedesae TaxID=418985 RepID=A0A1V9XLG1_9ACAR|nr:glucose-6-phosphate 1-dehydrogenase X-like [Tropilaelaps mercedesae]